MEYNALYIQLMNRILDKMRRGEYQVGDKMDSERVWHSSMESTDRPFAKL